MMSVFSIACAVLTTSVVASGRPNILFVVADDLGYADAEVMVESPATRIRTPNLKSFAQEGVVLRNYHAMMVCSPSRAAFHTGRYPVQYGLQHYVISHNAAYSLPLNETLLPQVLATAGYQRHAVGKYHLGFYKWEATPTFRGYESFRGFYGGGEDYYSHVAEGNYDMRDDQGERCGPNCSRVAWDWKGQYSTTLFTGAAEDVIERHDPEQGPLFMYLAYQAVHAPAEVPAQYVEPYEGVIQSKERRTFAGMLSCLDEGFGNVTRALEARGMLNNTVIVFSSDNGGPTTTGDSVGARNWPLRGGKHSLWRGGETVTGFVWAPPSLMPARGPRSYDNIMHAVDWLPTLAYGLAGAQPGGTLPLDGVDHWDFLAGTNSTDKPPRDGFLGNIDRDHLPGGHWAIQRDCLKLLQGEPGPPDGSAPPFNATAPPTASACRSSGESSQERAGYGDTTGTCYIKTAMGSREPCTGTSGQLNGTSPCVQDPGYCYPGHDIVPRGIEGKTAAECCQECQARTGDGCAFFTLNDKAEPYPFSNTTRQMFDVCQDPEERVDVLPQHQQAEQELLQEIAAFNSTLMPPQKGDPACPKFDPSKYNHTWTPWC